MDRNEDIVGKRNIISSTVFNLLTSNINFSISETREKEAVEVSVRASPSFHEQLPSSQKVKNLK